MDARRPVLMLLLSIVAGWSFAQAPARNEPLPPPPLPDVLSEADTEPQVTILHDDNQTTETVRVQGQLRYVRVTPRYGRPYYLFPSPDGNYIRRDGIDATVWPPMWVLFSF
jgi:hypothetical protein